MFKQIKSFVMSEAVKEETANSDKVHQAKQQLDAIRSAVCKTLNEFMDSDGSKKKEIELDLSALLRAERLATIEFKEQAAISLFIQAND